MRSLIAFLSIGSIQVPTSSLIRRFWRYNFTGIRAFFDTLLEFVSNTTSPHAKCVQSKAVARGQLGTLFDFCAFVALVVLENELLVRGDQLLKTATQTG